MKQVMNNLQQIPSIDSLLQHNETKGLLAAYGRNLVMKSLRTTIEELRVNLKNNKESLPSNQEIIQNATNRIKKWIQPSLTPVINATGIILHTNMGRSPLSSETVAAMQAVSQGYSNLEFNLRTGKRGKRAIHAEALLQNLTGAESALVVNNNASAVMLVLSALANRKRVIIANSQLVEIGGGFRVPDVMRQSGAKLAAVGTTNRVHISDYEKALEEPAALILTAHHSNFKIVGFTTEPETGQITKVAHKAGIPLVSDLGSGALLDTGQFGLAHEPTVQETLQAGADIVCFSGDKLLGGPQAGIIVGRADLLKKIKRHPFARAVRADKLCLAGISSTLIHYLKGEALIKIPVWQMISMDLKHIKKRAQRWKDNLGRGDIIPGQSMVGGGSLPEESLPTSLFALKVKNPDKFLAKLRSLPIPIIARIEKDMIVLDPRTIVEDQDTYISDNLVELLR